MLREIEHDAGFPGSRLFIAFAPIARHPAPALKLAERDRQIAVTLGSGPGLRTPLGIVRTGGIADDKPGRIRPAAVRGLGQKLKSERFAPARKGADLPAMDDFAWQAESVRPPARVVNVALLVGHPQPGERGPPVRRGAAIHRDDHQVCASLTPKAEAPAAGRKESVPYECRSDWRDKPLQSVPGPMDVGRIRREIKDLPEFERLPQHAQFVDQGRGERIDDGAHRAHPGGEKSSFEFGGAHRPADTRTATADKRHVQTNEKDPQRRKALNPVGWVMAEWQARFAKKHVEEKHRISVARLRLLTTELALHDYQSEH